MTGSKLIARGAMIALGGFILSGPVGFLIVMLTHPQPAWISSAVFVEHYHWIQNLPYYLGFLLVGGMVMVLSGHYQDYKGNDEGTRFLLLIAVILSGVFAALVIFNYVCQTTYIHNLAVHYSPENDHAIAAFSMSNPLSFCWANEMWGYAVLGVATALLSGYYRRSRLLVWLLWINAVVSIAAPIWTIIDVTWVMTTIGLSSYFFWNILMIVIMILIYRSSKNERPQHV